MGENLNLPGLVGWQHTRQACDWPQQAFQRHSRLPLDPALSIFQACRRNEPEFEHVHSRAKLLIAAFWKGSDENGSHLLSPYHGEHCIRPAKLSHDRKTRNYVERCEWCPIEVVPCTGNVIQNATAAPKRSHFGPVRRVGPRVSQEGGVGRG